MSFADEMSDLIAEREAEIEAVFRWNSTDYPVAAGSFRKGKALSEGGFSLSANGTINIRTNLFDAGQPQLQQTGTYTGPEFPTGRRFRIEDIVPGVGYIQLVVVDDSKGA